MKRLIFVSLAFLVGCSGAGSAGSRFLPLAPNSTTSALDTSAVVAHAPSGVNSVRRGHKVKVRVTLRIPRRHRGSRISEAHPATISPLTQSVSFVINGGTAQVFNATPSSPGCISGLAGTTCTFSVSAPVGTDNFVVSTFNAAGGGGAMLDRGVATIVIVAGKNNTPAITLGPVASSTADSGVGSLRYAIGAANPGDTIMFAGLAAGSVITLASPITISNSVNVAGPGVTASLRRADARRPQTTYSGLTISGGGTVQIFVVNGGATVTISGLILTQGNATTTSQPGGAVYNAGSLTLANDALVANTTAVYTNYVRKAAMRHARPHHNPLHAQSLHPHCAGTDAYAGAVYNHATLTVTGSTFDSNVAPSNPSCSVYGYGGGIYNDQYGSLASSSNTYVNNAAYEGGAVYNNSEFGSGDFTGDTFDANLGCTATSGCPTSGCTPSGTCTGYAEGYGAAISDEEGPGIAVSGCTFTSNVAGGSTPGSYGDGGALNLETGAPSVTGSAFTGNVAGGGASNESEGYGGAIYYDGAGPLQANNDTFTSNAASSDYYSEGGAIYSDEGINGTNDTFTTNTAAANGSLAESEPDAYGGAIYMDGDNLNMSGSTFNGNTATSAYESEAGGVFLDGPARLSGDTFTSNTAVSTGVTDEYTYAYGGAIYDDSGNLTVSGTTFTSNAVKALGTYDYYVEGGAIYNDGNGMSSTGDTFTSNSATATGNYLYPYAYGGAIYSDETLTSSGDTFKSNSISGLYYNYGGAIYSDDTLTANNDTFSGNSASGAYYSYGGALLIYSSASISNSTFDSNTNTGLITYGGAIYNDGSLTLSGSTVSNNASTYYGGGIYTEGAEQIYNSAIAGNKVTAAGYEGGGGGIFIDGGLTDLEGSTISGNSVNATAFYGGGGGVYNYSGAFLSEGNTVSANSVTGSSGLGASGGGGVLNDDEFVIINSTITGNTSAIDGGGLENICHCGPTELINATVVQNTATGNGGNIDNNSVSSSLAELEMANTIAAGGSAVTGPDVNNSGILNSGDYNIIQTPVGGTALSGMTTHNLAVSPALLALASNGGPTQTMADQATSPGTGYIPFSGLLCGNVGNTTDQRGFTRGAGGKCDVGAYEFAGVGSALRAHSAGRSHPEYAMHPIKRNNVHEPVRAPKHPPIPSRNPQKKSH